MIAHGALCVEPLNAGPGFGADMEESRWRCGLAAVISIFVAANDNLTGLDAQLPDLPPQFERQEGERGESRPCELGHRGCESIWVRKESVGLN